jgi:hypothetical protein
LFGVNAFVTAMVGRVLRPLFAEAGLKSHPSLFTGRIGKGWG